MRGMEVLAKAVQGKRVALVLGVQGKDTAEMLEYARTRRGARARRDDRHAADDRHVDGRLSRVFPRAGRRHDAPGDRADERRRQGPRPVDRSHRRAGARVPELRRM